MGRRPFHGRDRPHPGHFEERRRRQGASAQPAGAPFANPTGDKRRTPSTPAYSWPDLAAARDNGGGGKCPAGGIPEPGASPGCEFTCRASGRIEQAGPLLTRASCRLRACRCAGTTTLCAAHRLLLAAWRAGNARISLLRRRGGSGQALLHGSCPARLCPAPGPPGRRRLAIFSIDFLALADLSASPPEIMVILPASNRVQSEVVTRPLRRLMLRRIVRPGG